MPKEWIIKNSVFDYKSGYIGGSTATELMCDVKSFLKGHFEGRVMNLFELKIHQFSLR